MWRRVFFIVLLGMLVAGCKDELLEQWYKGTTKGVALCKKNSADLGMSALTISTLCTERHQRRMEDTLEGTAGYEQHFGTVFRGRVSNKSHEFVVTRFSVWLEHDDAPGDRTLGSFKDYWIEPDGLATFEIGGNDLKYVPKADSPQKGKFSWSVTDVYGVRVSF